MGKYLSETFKNTYFEEHLPNIWTDFKKWFFGTLLLDCIYNYLDSVILQKYQSLSNQTFKKNLAYRPSI